MNAVRVIAGTLRGRSLLPPRDASVTRPITDRVKTSLFDRLGAAGVLEGANVLDVFAGTGGIGVEALSRGARRCTFVEHNRSAAELLRRNLARLGLAGRSLVLQSDALKLRAFGEARGDPFDLIFCDPPYRMTRDGRAIEPVHDLARRLATSGADGCVLVLRTDAHAPATAFDGWDGPRTHRYGSMSLHFYERPGGADTPAGDADAPG